MTSTTITNDFSLTDLNKDHLIKMSSNFTSVEASFCDDKTEAIIEDGSRQQTKINPSKLSTSEWLLNICRLGMMLILFLPITIADKLREDDFLPNM
ncbi:MAG: hypothetical protein AAGA80_19665 [Cyanobacteria bacterium P01_F01_bin.143]